LRRARARCSRGYALRRRSPIAEEMIAQEMMAFKMLPHEVKDEILLEKDHEAFKGIMWQYEEHEEREELERLFAEAEEIYAEERMAVDVERAKVDADFF
jgi:hypothetical protein